tara:strand:- start:297 stop:866 length:570 start_codon:yes stop_codon:yes gene_type:complete
MDSSGSDYFTFDDFVKQYFQEKQILIEDLNNTNNKQFYDKYKINKNVLHKECVEQYKTRYETDYNKHLKLYKVHEQRRISELKEKRRLEIESRKNELVEILMRQTDYSREVAFKELEEVDFNVSEAVKKYMNPENNKSVEQINPTTTNQKIYKEIRDFMDKGAADYEKRKEYSNFLMEQQERLRNNNNE